MSSARIRAVLFDLDDTLVDHTNAIRGAVADLYKNRPELSSKFLDEATFQAAWVNVQDKYYPVYLRGVF